eukprot:TRINITY_DN5544_c0_g1_i1.p1 TRINITY_DN5544_c0_g1~~TRINITY_DN5544_c0_g1_i1.p1  ORF type:complete len:721 (+),score=65.87 TRINITY_DN5544_c0_g1_i1:167-2164(+)
MPNLSTASSIELSDDSVYHYSIRVTLDHLSQAQAMVKILNHYGVKYISIITNVVNSQYAAVTYDALVLSNITVESYSVINNNIEQVILQTRAKGVHAMVVILSSNDFVNFVESAKKAHLTGYPYVFFGGQATNFRSMLLTENRTEFVGNFGLESVDIVDPNSVESQAYLKTIGKFGFDLTNRSRYDAFTRDSLYCVALAIHKLLVAGFDVESIRQELLLDALTNQDFRGVSGRLSFLPNGKRITGRIGVINIFDRDSSRLYGRQTLLFDYEHNIINTTVLEEPVFPRTDSSQAPDFSKLSPPVDYFDCRRGEKMVDTRGLLEFDEENIEPDKSCNGIFDCHNYSDERQCSVDLWLTQLSLLILTSCLICLFLLIWILVLLHRMLPETKAIGCLWLSFYTLLCIAGLLSMFAIYGINTTTNCIIAEWLAGLSSGLIMTMLTIRLITWWKTNPSANSSKSRNITSDLSDKGGDDYDKNKNKTSNNSSGSSTGSRTTQQSENHAGKAFKTWGRRKMRRFNFLAFLFLAVIEMAILIGMTIFDGEVDSGKRCGSFSMTFWILALVVVDLCVGLVGLVVAVVLQKKGTPFNLYRIISLVLINNMALGVFLSTLYMSLYSQPLAGVIISMVMVIVFFSTSFLFLYLPLCYYLLLRIISVYVPTLEGGRSKE